MAPPEKRTVAPGAQPVRIDNVKDKSWVDVHRLENLRSQIFFPTDDATLDKDAMDQLDIIVREYTPDMRANPSSNYLFEFYGHADHRHTDKHNQELSQRRAAAVEQYLWGYLSPFVNYVKPPEVRGLGIDLSDPRTSEDSKSLARYRRVNIVAPPLRGVPPPPPDPPPPSKPQPVRSTNWKARMKAAGSGSIGPITADHFYMDFVDLDHNHILEMRYMGFGFGASPAPAGASYSKDPTDWVSFKTNKPVAIEEFEGFAFHTAGQAQVSGAPGGTFDLVTLTLAHSRQKPAPDWVHLKFLGFTILDPNAGLGASQTGGAVQPTPEYGEWREWRPTDP